MKKPTNEQFNQSSKIVEETNVILSVTPNHPKSLDDIVLKVQRNKFE